MQSYRRAAELQPDAASTLYERIGDLWISQQRYSEATEALHQAVKSDPANVGAYYSLGTAYEVQQQWQEAQDMYEKVNQLSLEFEPTVNLKLGYLLMQQGDAEGAEKEYRRAMKLAPDQANGYLALAQLYKESEQWDKAIQVYNNAAKLGADVASSVYLYIGDIYRKLGNVKKMRAICNKVVRLVNNVVSPDYNLLRRQGLAHLMRGEHADAAQSLRRALDADATDAKARFYMALNLLCQNDLVQAQEELSQGVRLAQTGDDYGPAIEEAEVLAARMPEIAGANELLQALVEAKRKIA